MIRVMGLSPYAHIGDRLYFESGLTAEILGIDADVITAFPEAPVDGLALGMECQLLSPPSLTPNLSWLGRVIDPLGQALDERPLLRGAQSALLSSGPPPAAKRRTMGCRCATGMTIFDTILPIARGQRIGLFAGSGVGKTMLLGQFARGMEADVIVIALIGERGRELREFVERVLGAEGMKRSIIVAATSDQSPTIRRRCLSSAISVAEHFRDLGLHVLLLADSVTRFAEAHREIAFRLGEVGQMRGFPPSTAQMIMSLSERAGPGPDSHQGDITAIFTVLVAGSDMEEPIADILRSVLDGHVVMDRSIAERGRFPAIDILRSVSRSLPHIASDEENRMISEARQLLGCWDRAELMIQAGLYAKGSDPNVDAAIRAWPALDGLAASVSPSIEHSFAQLSAALSSAHPPSDS